MEAFKHDSFSFGFPQTNIQANNPDSFFRRTPKKFTSKSTTYLNGLVKSRLRRINSISQNIASLFKQNHDKLCLYLKPDSLLSNPIASDNLENPQIYATLSDGVYILIQGSVKVISFSQDRPLPRTSMKEITSTYFRKLKSSKEPGSKRKDPPSELIKKTSSNSDKNNQNLYTCATLDQPFTVFECINENCCSLSNQTVLYMLDDDQKKNYKYFQNKQKLQQAIHENRPFFKTDSMLFHTFLYKKLHFRTQFKVQNVALIKKGTLRVYPDHIKKQDIANLKLQNIKHQVCELCEPCLLVKGFTYEVSSFESEIIFIENNDSFQFIKNPEWVVRFQKILAQKNQRKAQSLKKHCKKGNHGLFKKQMSKIGPHQPVLHNFLTEHSSHESQPARFFQTFHLDKEAGQNKFPSPLGHRKSFSEVRSGSSHVQSQKGRLLPHEKEKKHDMLKLISPYVLISQKTGLKEIIKTRNILNERNQNLTPMKENSLLKLNKVSKNHLNKYHTQYSEPMYLQKYNLQNIPNDRRALLRFEKFLQQKNQRNYHEKLKQNKENMLKTHRKSSSELAQITSSNFYLGLKKNKLLDFQLTFEVGKSSQWENSGIKKKGHQLSDLGQQEHIA